LNIRYTQKTESTLYSKVRYGTLIAVSIEDSTFLFIT